MSHTLLVWEILPKETELYMIPDTISHLYNKYLCEAHNNFINVGKMNDGLRFLYTALAESDPEEGFEEYLSIFRPLKCDSTKPITRQFITAVYQSGFQLYGHFNE